MTFEEYQNLYKEWKETDSIKRKEELEEQIFKVAHDLAKKMIGVYDKWGKKFVKDDDFRNDRGDISLDTEELEYDGNTKVWLKYIDSWAHGGYCEFGIDVPMKFLDEKNVQILEDQFLDENISTLDMKIAQANSGIRILEESRSRYYVELNKMNKLKKERDKEKSNNGY